MPTSKAAPPEGPKQDAQPMGQDAVRIADLEEYFQFRRAYLMSRRDAAETEFGKSKFIGALQALNDFEEKIKQVRIVVAPAGQPACLEKCTPKTAEELGAQWLAKFGLQNVSFSDFRDNSWQNKMIATYPNKRDAIVLIGNLARNSVLVDTVLKAVHGSTDFLKTAASAGAPAAPATSVTPAIQAGKTEGHTCPFCGKSYKYSKALDSHKKTCPKNPSP